MIHRSPDPDVEIPVTDVTSFVLESAAERADKPALIDGPTGRTSPTRSSSGAFARSPPGSPQRGFGKGDVLALYMPNLPEYAVAFHGVASAGGTCTTVNPLYTAERARPPARRTPARRILVTVPPFLETAPRGRASAPGSSEVFVLGEAEGATPFAELLGDPAAAPEVDDRPATTSPCCRTRAARPGCRRA